jgi:hypothetical protein
MRTYVFVIAGLLFFSCNKKQVIPPSNNSGHPPYQCVVEATDPRMKVSLSVPGITRDSITGWRLRKYERNDSFNILIEDSRPDSSFITSGYDWEVYLPAMNQSIWISNIEFIPRTDTAVCPLSYGHYTKLAGMTVLYDNDSLSYDLASAQYDPLTLRLSK